MNHHHTISDNTASTAFSSIMSRLFHGLFGICWVAMLPGILLTCLFLDWKGLLAFGIFLLTAGILFGVCFRKQFTLLSRALREWIEAHSLIALFFLLMAVQIGFQIICGYELAVEPSSDRHVIFEQASQIALSNNWHTTSEFNYYFLRYPNNLFLLLLEAVYFTVLKIFGFTNFLYGNMLLNIFCIDLAIGLCVLLAYRRYGKGAAVLFQVLCMLFLPFYTYIPFVYTDTLILPSVAGILLCYELAEEYWAQGKNIRVLAALAAIGVLSFIGYELKPTIVIFPIACILHMLIAKGGHKAVLCAGILIVSFVLCAGIYQKGIQQLNVVDQTDYDKENFPYTHWVMMGLQGIGNYNLADREYTSSFPTKAEKEAANLTVIKIRLKQYGFFGLTGHQYVKAVATWCNGKYDMNFHLKRKPLRQSWLQQFFLENGSCYWIYSSYCSVFQFFLLAMVTISILQGFLKKQLDSAVMWKLALCGLFFFLAIWESKSRYVMHFTPVMLLIALDTIVNAKRRKYNHLAFFSHY